MKKRSLSFLLSAVIAMSTAVATLPAVTVLADEKVEEAGSIDLGDNSISISPGEYDTYVSYSFKTLSLKGYYYFVMNSTSPERSPSVYVSKSPSVSSGEVINSNSISGIINIGDVLGGEENLTPDTTYYLSIQRMVDIDYTANFSLVFLPDNEADIAELAETYVPGKKIEASIDGAKDIDVWAFKANDTDYRINSKALTKDSVELYIYSDDGFYNSVNDFTITSEGRSVDISGLEKGKTYYIVFKCMGNHLSGYSQDYEFKMTGKNASSTDSSSSSTSDADYLKLVKNSKFFVTNMTSKVAAKLTGAKLVLTKAGDGFLCKKSKLSGNIFTKISILSKSKYSYKLADSYKIIYVKKEDGSANEVKTKKWFNQNFKKNGMMYGKYNFGVCVNKSGKVNAILISAFDIGAEQI